MPLGRFQPPSQQIAVDVRVDEVVLKALEKDPERRYQRAGDVRRDVERVGTPDATGTPPSADGPATTNAVPAPPLRTEPMAGTSDTLEGDQCYLPAMVLASTGIVVCSELLGAAFAPLVRHHRRWGALAAGSSPYPDLNHKVAEIEASTFDGVLKILEPVGRGEPLPGMPSGATRMSVVEHACDDGRAVVAAVRAVWTGNTLSSRRPSVEAIERVDEHVRSLDRLFATLPQSAGDSAPLVSGISVACCRFSKVSAARPSHSRTRTCACVKTSPAGGIPVNRPTSS